MRARSGGSLITLRANAQALVNFEDLGDLVVVVALEFDGAGLDGAAGAEGLF